MTTTLAIFAVILIAGAFVGFFRAKRNAEKAATRRAALALAAECQAREDERRKAWDASKVIFSPLDVERAFTDEVKPLFPSKPVKKPAKAKKARHVPVKKRKAKKS
jgi:hypothetical protein